MKCSYFVNATTLRILGVVVTPSCFSVSFMDERKVCSFKVDYEDNSVSKLFNTKLYHDTLKNRCDYFISTNAFIRVFKDEDNAYIYTLIKDN